MKVYCDTNIYLDFLLDRTSPTGEPLGLYAQWVFSYARRCYFLIMISDHVVSEVKKNLRSDKHIYFNKLLKKLEPKLIKVNVTDDDRAYAQKIDLFDNFSDALHVTLAVRHRPTPSSPITMPTLSSTTHIWAVFALLSQ